MINGTGGGTFVTQWSYDSADRPVWMKYPGGSAGQIGEQVNYAYTTQGLLDTVQSNGGVYYVGKTRYNVRGQVAERWLGSTTGVVKQLYAYTAAENFRLVSMKAGTGTTNDNRQNISYAYDDAGNVLMITDAAAYGGSQAQTFAYDTLDRLSTAQASGSTTYGGYTQRSYAYSNAGNLTTFEGAGTNLYYQDSAHKHAVTHVGGTTASYQKYWYDQNGNATRRISGSQDVTLTYDAENRLTAMAGGVTASYVYDGDGQRVKETIAGVTRVFVGNTYEVDNGAVKKYYYAGSVRVAENSGGALYYLLTDHLGSTALTLDSAGNRLDANTEIRYYPYGAPRYTAGTTPTTFNFTGQRRDSGSGLLFYNARWYDPVIGRFISADTIVPEPGNPQSLNRYSYVLNNPLGAVDGTGHWPEWVNNAFSYTMGAVSQYLNNLSLGAFAALAVHGDLSSVESDSYQQGRELGAILSDAQAKFEIATGIGMAAAGTAAIAPTLGGGGVCTLATAGVCALPAGGALVAEGAMVAGGGALAGHGAGVLLYAKSHPVERMGDVQKHGRPGSNTAQNKQFRGAVRSAQRELEQELGRKLSPDEIQELHEALHELENPGFDDIVNLARDLFGGK